MFVGSRSFSLRQTVNNRVNNHLRNGHCDYLKGAFKYAHDAAAMSQTVVTFFFPVLQYTGCDVYFSLLRVSEQARSTPFLALILLLRMSLVP